jgi:hypothetical protein
VFIEVPNETMVLGNMCKESGAVVNDYDPTQSMQAMIDINEIAKKTGSLTTIGL